MFRTNPDCSIILASGSPRRKELLSGVGLSFSVLVSNVDESVVAGESAGAMVQRLALRKAWAVAPREPSVWTIGADTTVVIDGQILGKPENAEDAVRMLRTLSGAVHEVVGAFCVLNPARAVELCEVHRSRVQMMTLSPELIAAYVRSGEPFDKAGGYAVQGVGASFISAVEGSYTNVVGLNLSALISSLMSRGVISYG